MEAHKIWAKTRRCEYSGTTTGTTMDKQQFKVVPTTTIKVPLGVRYGGDIHQLKIHFILVTIVPAWGRWLFGCVSNRKHALLPNMSLKGPAMNADMLCHPIIRLNFFELYRIELTHQALFCRQIPDTTIFPQQTCRLVSSLNCLSLSLPKFGPTPTGVRVQILRGLKTCRICIISPTSVHLHRHLEKTWKILTRAFTALCGDVTAYGHGPKVETWPGDTSHPSKHGRNGIEVLRGMFEATPDRPAEKRTTGI